MINIFYLCFSLGYMIGNYEVMKTKEDDSNIVILYEEINYKETIENCLFTVLFLIERLIYAACIVFLDESPYIQVAILSITSYTMLILMIKHKPYYERARNIIKIYVGICVFLVYSGIGLYLNNWKLNEKVYEIGDLVLCGLVVSSVAVPFCIQLPDLMKQVLQFFRSLVSNTKNKLTKSDPVITINDVVIRVD